MFHKEPVLKLEKLSPKQIEEIQNEIQYGWMTLKALVVKTENLTKDQIRNIQNQGETFVLDFFLEICSDFDIFFIQ